MKNSLHFALIAAMAVGLSACGKSEPKAEAPRPAAAAAGKTAAKGEASQGHAEKKGEGQAHADQQVLKLTAEEVAAAGIRTEVVREGPIRASMSLSATIQPNRDRYAHVAPRLPGRILEVPAKLGENVRAGQVLAILDSVEVGESTSAYQQATSQLNVAKADFERAQKLYDEQVVPQKDFLRARGEFERARAAQVAAVDKLRMMGIEPGSAGVASSRLPVMAPFAGAVIEKVAVVGELAQPDKALFTVADLSTVWIEANLNEKDLPKVGIGAMAEVSVAAYPNEVFRGRVAYVGASVDKESRTVKARIDMPNPQARLKPEMFATARIDTDVIGNGMVVPSGAVVLADNKKVVFVKEVDGFELREVELGEEFGGRQVVKAGLSSGDEVVVAGVYALKARAQKSKIGHGHSH